jgi:hypothetical protein
MPGFARRKGDDRALVRLRTNDRPIAIRVVASHEKERAPAHRFDAPGPLLK